MEKGPRTFAIIGAAMEVHGQLGCGFLESVYQEALALEFEQRKISYKGQVNLPISYKGVLLTTLYRADFICFEAVIVEIKAGYATPVTRDREKKMKGGISVLVAALLVVFSLTMVAEAQRKNRIRGNQGRKSVGKPGNTIQRKRRGAGTALQSTSKGFIRSTPGAGSAGRLRNSVESGGGEGNSFTTGDRCDGRDSVGPSRTPNQPMQGKRKSGLYVDCDPH